MEIALAAERGAYDRNLKARNTEIREENRRWVRYGSRYSPGRGDKLSPCRHESPGAELRLKKRKANENREAHESEMLHARWGVLPEVARAIRSRVARLFKF